MYPYQKVGVEFLLESGGRAIVADSPGVGKSLQALAYIVHEKFERTLIIAPASVKSSWRNEIRKWTNLSYVVIDSKTEVEWIPHDIQVWVINYDILKRFLPELLKIRFDAIIADEAHLVKSITTQRTKAVKLLSKNIPRIVLLTGTPLLSRPIEMYTLLNMIDQKNWSNYYDFGRKYCGGHQGRYGWDVSGATNTNELHDKIKKYFIRRQKSEVLTQLPPKIHIEQTIELPDDVAKQYDMVENNLVKYLKQYGGKQPAEIARAVQAEKLTQLNILRQLISLGGLDSAIELIESIIEADEKVLVFSSFVEPIERLKEKFGATAVVITGSTPVGERGAIVDKFQNDKDVKVFLGGFKSAGAGITLTAASNIIMLDYPWNPADSEQAENRAHRPGAEYQSLNIYQFHAPGTISDKLKQILEKKQKTIDQVVDGKGYDKKEENAIKEVVDDIMLRRGGKWKPMELD